jgi:hypothetical protein
VIGEPEKPLGGGDALDQLLGQVGEDEGLHVVVVGDYGQLWIKQMSAGSRNVVAKVFHGLHYLQYVHIITYYYILLHYL